MKFANLMSFQKPPQGLEDLHAKATTYAALTPRLRTVFLEECEIEAKECIQNTKQDANKVLQYTCNINIGTLNIQRENTYSAILTLQQNRTNILNAKKSSGLQRQASSKNDSLSDFVKAKTIPDKLAPLKNLNQFDSLKHVFLTQPETALPFKFRILSRANEIYGANNWGTRLANTPENFYDLLMGSADDEYHSDLEPVQNTFLQGAAGNFVCNKIFAVPDGYSYATGSAPMAAVGAFAFENITDQDIEKSIKFGLSSYNFAAVYLKTNEWTPLFQSTSNINHDSVRTADFVLPAHQTATILLVATPYHYLYSSSRGRDAPTTYQSHLVQFLQWDLFGVREMLGSDLVWAQLLGEVL
jgi:hypothetical protein